MAMQQTEIETMIREEAISGRADRGARIWPATATSHAATVVTPAFKGINKVKQHQMVYAALKGRMGGDLHALALTTSGELARPPRTT